MFNGESAEPQQIVAGSARRRGRLRLALALAATVTGCTSLLLTPAATGAVAPCWDSVRSDVDGGGPDVLVGLPGYDLPGKSDAGAVLVFSNVAGEGESNPSSPTVQTVVTAEDVGLPSAAGARFGASLALWRQFGEDCADLLVGAPGARVNGLARAGQVHLVDGSEGGLTQVLKSFDEDSIPGAGGAQAGAAFGSAIAADGSSMLAIGAPRRDLGTAADAGRVVQLDYSLAGAPAVHLVQQGGAGAGTPEAGDRFGEVLELVPTGLGTLMLVGVPAEDVGRNVDAGAVALQPSGGPLSMVTQDSRGAAGTAEAGDRYGAALDTFDTFPVDHPVVQVAIGVPGEDLDRGANAGMVSFAAVDLYFDPQERVGPIAGRSVTVTQDSPGVPGSVEAGDAFGSAVLTAEFGTDSGRLHLVVGSPTEDLAGAADGGMVTMTAIDRVSGAPLPGPQPGSWSQDSAGVSGVPEAGDRFGANLNGVQLTTVQDDEDSVWAIVQVLVPGEDIGSGTDAGMAYLGVAPGRNSVPLVPAPAQSGAGRGMVGLGTLIG